MGEGVGAGEKRDRVGGTRRGGRKASEWRGWSSERVEYEVGLVIEGVVWWVQAVDLLYDYEGGLDSLYWEYPFRLLSLPWIMDTEYWILDADADR